MGLYKKIKERGIKFTVENKLFVVIFILAACILFYYLSVTANQALWFDEADYMNYARFLAFGHPEWGFNPVRPPLFSLIASVMMKIGFGEIVLRFLVVLFALTNVFLTYILAKDLFGKEVGAIAAFLQAVFWSHLFFAMRLLVDVPVLTFWLASAVCCVRGYIKKRSHWYRMAVFPLLFIGFLMKYTNALLAFVILSFLLITEHLQFLKDKTFWQGIGITGLLSIPFFIWQYKAFDHPFAFFIQSIIKKGGIESKGFFDSLFGHIAFLFPLAGIIILIGCIIGFVYFMDIFMGIDLLWKGKETERRLKEKCFILLWFVFILLFVGKLGYGLYIEERYYFNLYVAMFIVMGYGLMQIHTWIKNQRKELATITLVIILFSAAFTNLNQADAIIKGKAESFKQVKEAGAWLHTHLEEDEKFWSQPVSAEMQYHAGRRNQGPGYNINAIVADKKLKYLVLAGFNPMTDEYKGLPLKYPGIFKPVQVYTVDGKNPIVIIFEIMR